MNNPLLDRFPGVIGFPVTPFDDNDQLDEVAFRTNLDFMAAHEFAALCSCGSNGEMPSLTIDEYRRVAAVASEATQGKMGLIMGVGQTLHTAQAMARIARESGADGILLVSPYSNDLSDEGLADYYRRVAEVAEISVALYQTKWSGLLSFKLLDLLSDVENICMVKDENGSIGHFVNVRQRFGDRYYWINGMAEPFVPAYWNLGIRTYTSGLACFMPEQTMQIGKFAESGDFDSLNTMLDEVVTPLYQIRNRRPGYKCSMIKTAMTLCGLPGGRVRSPLIEMAPEDCSDLEALLDRVGLLKNATAL
jgi:5-dehydro-4-deoxyglucarate dehydratase